METLYLEKNKEKKTEFKSYYVVWKQGLASTSYGDEMRLNRTM